ITLAGANLGGVIVVLLASTLAFVGLGVMAAALPVLSPERGAEATHIFQGSLLLVSGVYYPVEVLPAWLRPISALSPATYTLAACRRLFGVGDPATTPQRLAGAPLASVPPELGILIVMGAALVPLRRPGLQVRILTGIGLLLEGLHVPIVVLHHLLHVRTIEVRAVELGQPIVETLMAAVEGRRQRDALLRRQLLQLVGGLLVIVGHPLAKLLHAVRARALTRELPQLHLGHAAFRGLLHEVLVAARDLRVFRFLG